MATKPLSVSAAVGLAKRTVEDLPQLSVVGEVSGFRGPNARSGHCYFAVKDESAAMDVIVWKGVYQGSGVELRDGLEVSMSGVFQVYERSGRLSFVARRLELAGEGLLRQRVAELARRLEAEGLMDASRKRHVPVFCERVCVVTSPSGAVIDDVKQTLARRNPLVAIDVVGCAVQGDHAPATIVHALEVAAATRPDAVLLVRGGGSFEDLMAFNDEAVARAVAACPVPVVTGIGHEPDTSIADMVADRRCSTPTAAAESVAPDEGALRQVMEERARRLDAALAATLDGPALALDALAGRLALACQSRVSLAAAQVEALAARPVLQGPAAIVDARRDLVELLSDDLTDAVDAFLDRAAQPVADASARLARAAAPTLQAPSATTDALAGRLARAAAAVTAPGEHLVARAAQALDALSPLKVLGRGYAIVRGPDGRVVDSVSKICAGDLLDAVLADGSVSARVVSVQRGERDGEPRVTPVV